jgi:NitT/TauT family transport system ATP-binding protein
MIEVNELFFTYSHTPPLFQHFNWNVKRGEKWAIIGSSGCGKTTLLYLLAGLLTPSGGKIIIDGEHLTHPRPRTGLILQDYGLLPWATVRQNAELGTHIRGFYGPDGKHAPIDPARKTTVQAWLTRLGIDSIADKYPSQVSGGQRQRTAIARTLVLDPDILLMDEPFSSLDAITREDLQNLVLDLSEEQGLTLVIVTHAIEEAAALGNKILLLGADSRKKMRVFDNPQSGYPDYRRSKSYQDLCIQLWKAMQDEAA